MEKTADATKSHLHLPISVPGGGEYLRLGARTRRGPLGRLRVEGWIHSKKSNRLGQKTVEQLVRSHTNQSAAGSAGSAKRAQTTAEEPRRAALFITFLAFSSPV
eukprot:scaffold2146_cov145-Isochrysis_galbana.AAC.6